MSYISELYCVISITNETNTCVGIGFVIPMFSGATKKERALDDGIRTHDLPDSSAF